jgi:hypothetical protein
MLNYITPPEDLKSESLKIQEFLEITCSEQAEEVVQRGNDLAVYIARTGKMLADAKHFQDQRKKDSIMIQLKEIGKGAKIPASTLNDLINASCKEENYLVTWIDRLNRSATHQMDWCRTLVSKAKEEMKISSGISQK